MVSPIGHLVTYKKVDGCLITRLADYMTIV